MKHCNRSDPSSLLANYSVTLVYGDLSFLIYAVTIHNDGNIITAAEFDGESYQGDVDCLVVQDGDDEYFHRARIEGGH